MKTALARGGLEPAREAQRALLDALVGHMPDGVLAEAEDGRVAVANAAFCQLFGLPSDGRPDGSLIPTVQAQLADPGAWFPRARPGPGAPGTAVHLRDGRILEHQYFPVPLDDGRVLHVWQFRDSTARHQAEQALSTSQHRLRDLASHLQEAREEERRQLARELHDELGQLLTGVRLEVASAIEKFNSTRTAGDFDVVDRLQGAVGLVDLSIASIRRITTALRPPMLDRLGLMSAIRWEAALFERRTGIRCRVSSRPAAFETRAHVTVLYRILLEALTNVARHASAGTIRIGVRQRARHLTMEIRDNGRGISDAAMTNPATLGLVGMRERALAAGGEVRIARLAAGGTAVVVNLPYEPGAATPGSAGPGTEQPDA
jgi:signal transduction histidine kinase